MTALAAVLVCALPCPGVARVAPSPDREDRALALKSDIARFRKLDERLFDLGWQLARANAPYCSNRRLAIGLKLIDAARYRHPAIIREALGIRGDVAIGAIARGSSAARAHIAIGQEVASIASRPIARWPIAAPPDWRRLEQIHGFVEAELARKGSVTIGFSDGAEVTIHGEPICDARFELVANDERALSDGVRVRLGSRYRGFFFDDAILAAVIAHEIAHNILGHDAAIQTRESRESLARLREREADALAVWLVANAGFDPHDVARMIERLRPVSGATRLKRATHDHWRRRAKAARTEAAKVAALVAQGEPLDWRRSRPEWSEQGGALQRR